MVWCVSQVYCGESVHCTGCAVQMHLILILEVTACKVKLLRKPNCKQDFFKGIYICIWTISISWRRCLSFWEMMNVKLCLQCNNELHRDNMLYNGKNVQVCTCTTFGPFLRRVRGWKRCAPPGSLHHFTAVTGCTQHRGNGLLPTAHKIKVWNELHKAFSSDLWSTYIGPGSRLGRLYSPAPVCWNFMWCPAKFGMNLFFFFFNPCVKIYKLLQVFVTGIIIWSAFYTFFFGWCLQGFANTCFYSSQLRWGSLWLTFQHNQRDRELYILQVYLH